MRRVLRATVGEADTIGLCLGYALLVTGTALLSVPAGLILGGALLLTVAFVAARRP